MRRNYGLLMRVLQVTPEYFPNIGGVGIVAQKISESLIAKGASVCVCSVDLDNGQPKQETINGVYVKRSRPIIGNPLYLPVPDFITYIRGEDVDVIHVHNIHTLLPFLVSLLKRGNERLILQPHYHRFGQTAVRHFLFARYKQLIRTMACHRVDCVVANSGYEKRIFSEDFPEFTNVVLVPEGLPLQELESIKWNPVKPARILCVGTLRGYKNIDKVLAAFSKLIKDCQRNLRLVVVGTGPEYTRLAGLSRRLGIADQVYWKQDLSRSQLLSEYSEASVFVSLSFLESFSRVIYEALLIGVPTVTARFGATADLVKSGLVIGVNSLDPDEIAENILKAMEMSSSKLGTDPRYFLSWKKYVDRIWETYNDLR